MRTKSFGLSLLRNWYAPTTKPCTLAAVSSSADNLPIPELRMNATAMRDGREPAGPVAGPEGPALQEHQEAEFMIRTPYPCGRTRRFD
jgi:hypothetical protein